MLIEYVCFLCTAEEDDEKSSWRDLTVSDALTGRIFTKYFSAPALLFIGGLHVLALLLFWYSRHYELSTLLEV
jgi:hypothetical protein